MLKKSRQDYALPEHSTRVAPRSSILDFNRSFHEVFYGVLVVFGIINLMVDYFNGSFGTLMEYIVPVLPIIAGLISGFFGILFGALIGVSYICIIIAAAVIIIQIFKYLKPKN